MESRYLGVHITGSYLFEIDKFVSCTFFVQLHLYWTSSFIYKSQFTPAWCKLGLLSIIFFSVFLYIHYI